MGPSGAATSITGTHRAGPSPAMQHPTATKFAPSNAAGRRKPHVGGAHPNNPHDLPPVSEQENDAILAALMADIKGLKTSGAAISSELGRHNKILALLEGSFGQAKGSLSKVMSKVDEVSGMNASKHMWLLVLFAFGVFVFIYFLLKLKR